MFKITFWWYAVLKQYVTEFDGITSALGTNLHITELGDLLTCENRIEKNIDDLRTTYSNLLQISQNLQILSENVRTKACESIN